jgi:hypothetical protein
MYALVMTLGILFARPHDGVARHEDEEREGLDACSTAGVSRLTAAGRALLRHGVRVQS